MRAMVEGPVSSFFPASALQLHPRVTAFLDPDASRLLSMRDYYAETQGYDRELRASGRL